jgi:hypothetical protein
MSIQEAVAPASVSALFEIRAREDRENRRNIQFKNAVTLYERGLALSTAYNLDNHDDPNPYHSHPGDFCDLNTNSGQDERNKAMTIITELAQNGHQEAANWLNQEKDSIKQNKKSCVIL